MNTYFAFGSNMAQATLDERGVEATMRGAGFVADYRLAFTLPSQRWTGRAADLLPHRGGRVWGVVWRLDDGNALDQFELRYRRVPLRVSQPNAGSVSNNAIDAFTYMVRPENRADDEDLPAPAYLERMVSGASDAGIPRPYIRFLEGFGIS